MSLGDSIIHYETPNGELQFHIESDYVLLQNCEGRDVSIVVPDKVIVDSRELEVRGICKKAFLSNKYVHEIYVPESVAVLEDWCFAKCSSLEKIIIGKNAKCGRDIFLDCGHLTQIIFEGIQTKKSLDTSFLFAASINFFKAGYYFELTDVGKSQWFEAWDTMMNDILNTPDDEGFVALIAGGEEDYEGIENTLEGYINKSRINKVRIALLRLMHDYGLSDKNRIKLEDYLRRHRAGAYYCLDVYENGYGYTDDGYHGRTRTVIPDDSETYIYDKAAGRLTDETWSVVLNEHGDDEAYFKLLCETGCVTENNIDMMLNDMGDRHVRMKAFLLGFKEKLCSKDYFNNLEL